MIISLKMFLKLSHTYSINHQWYGRESFSEVILLLKVDRFEEFSNQRKIDGMVNDNSRSCNSKK